jgi:branched-subunit amino acid transport protein
VIESSYFWQSIFFLSLGTLFIKGFFIFMSDKINIPDRIRELFAFIPAAILPALITPMVFFHQGEVELLLGKERFIVLAISTVICYFTKSMLATVSFGLALLYVIT